MMNINQMGPHAHGLPNSLGVGGVNSPAANSNNNQFYMGQDQINLLNYSPLGPSNQAQFGMQAFLLN